MLYKKQEQNISNFGAYSYIDKPLVFYLFYYSKFKIQNSKFKIIFHTNDSVNKSYK